MSADKHLNMMRLQATLAASGKSHIRAGLVSSYDPDSMILKAMIQPDEIETGWLPIMVPQIGNGWGIYSPPQINDQVLIAFLEGSFETGVVIGALNSDDDRAPSVPIGEIWLVHKTGSFVKLLTDGTIASKGTWNHDGAFIATGDITDNHPANAITVKNLRDAYDAHKHAGVQTGSSSTGTTDHPV